MDQVTLKLDEIKNVIVQSQGMGLADWITIACTIVSLVVAFWALFSSISATKKQNKIALFDKRYDVYIELQKLFALCSALEKEKYTSLTDDEQKSRYLIGVLSRLYCTEKMSLSDSNCIIQLANLGVKTESILAQIPFLYSRISESDAQKLTDAFEGIFAYLVSDNNSSDNISLFVFECTKFEQRFKKKMENYLTN